MIFHKGGDSRVCIIKSYRQAESPPAGSPLRWLPRSRPEGHRHFFRTTSLRSIYKSMPIANEYRYVWYHTTITDIVWSMRKHCTSARKSTSALKYMVTITTFWDADMIDMPCTIDDHWRLRNMLVAKAPIDDKLRAEAPINAESRAQAPIDTESRAEALPSRKVGFKVVSLCFWIDGFLCFMDGHPHGGGFAAPRVLL